MTLRHRFVAVFPLLALLLVPCLSLCAGWESSAEMRMACCAGSHDDTSQAAADACCATGEHRRNTDSFGTLLIAALPVPTLDATPMASIVTAAPHVFFQTDHSEVSGPHRHVLLSVFLI